MNDSVASPSVPPTTTALAANLIRPPSQEPEQSTDESATTSTNPENTDSQADSADTPPSVSISAASATGCASVHSPSSSSGSLCAKGEGVNAAHGHFSPKVVYGPGTINRLPTELGRLQLNSPLIVSSPSRISLARRIQQLIPNLDSRILDSSLVNVPKHVVDDAVSRITGRDCVISIGGTSAVGLAKTIAGRKEIPHICIPAMYSGSELPSIADTRRRQKNENRRQRSGSGANASGSASTSGSSHSRHTDMHVKTLPSIIIYDEDLTAMSTPTRFSAPDVDKKSAENRRRSSNEDDSQWSYICLPGV